ncbi:MAG: septum formation family protein [Ardenticatenales bacterium]|nr:septum formation family protein [Ardenticatenales bacterium]
MKRLSALLMILSLLLAACGGASEGQATTVEVTREVVKEVTVEVEVTREVIITATPEPAIPEPDTDDSGDISAFEVEVGDCFGDPGQDDVSTLEAVPCDQPHDNEAYHLADYPAGPNEPFPGEEEIDTFAEEACVTAFEEYVGLSFQESVFQVTYLQPTEETWEDGDREVVCTLYSDEGPLEGSMKGSNR